MESLIRAFAVQGRNLVYTAAELDIRGSRAALAAHLIDAVERLRLAPGQLDVYVEALAQELEDVLPRADAVTLGLFATIEEATPGPARERVREALQRCR